MAALPFLPLATDAYLADCAHLDDAEHGRYLLILIELWRAPGQRLPNDDGWLGRRFKRPIERVESELRPLIKEFCECDGNWITQRRLTKEWKYVRKRSRQNSEAAKARWRKEKSTYERNALVHALRNAPTPTPTPTPTPIDDSAPNGAVARARERRGAITNGHRLPNDWRPSQADRDFASDLKLDPQLTAESFADYWHAIAGARGRKVDWSATWRGWCRREADRHAGRTPAVQPARGNDAFYAELARIAGRDRG